jgi:hypothetical protein
MFWWGTGAGALASALVVAALFAVGTLAFNQGGLVSLDPKKVEMEIQMGLEEQGVTTTVECPTTIVAPVGFSFSCMVGLPTGFTFADVTIANVLGELIWKARNEPMPEVQP